MNIVDLQTKLQEALNESMVKREIVPSQAIAMLECVKFEILLRLANAQINIAQPGPEIFIPRK